MADHRIGTVFVELDLDPSRYTKGQQQLLKDATQTTLNIEQNFKNLGIKSSAEMDLMRAKIKNSFDAITNSAKASANDKLRAEEVYHQKLTSLNDQQFGKQTNLIDKLKSNWLAASAVIASAGIIVGQAWDMAKEGAAHKEQMGILDNLSRKYSTSADSIVASMEKASDGLVAKSDLMQIALAGIAKGLKPEQLTDLADAARILGDAVGKDATTALKDLTEALETGRTKGLKTYLGTALDLDTAFGDLTSKMTVAEKTQAMYNITMIAATDLQGQQTKKVDETSDAIERLEAKWKNLKMEISKSLAGVVGAVLGTAEGDEQARLARARLAYMKGNQNIDYASISKLSGQDQNKYLDSLIAAENSRSESRFAAQGTSSYQADNEAIKKSLQARKDATEADKKALIDKKHDFEIYVKAVDDGEQQMYQSWVKYEHDMLFGDYKKDQALKKEQLDQLVKYTDDGEQKMYAAWVEYEQNSFKTTEKYAKDKADVNKQLYSDIGKTTNESYTFKVKLLDEEYDKYKFLVGNSTALNEAYAKRKKQLDQDLILSGNKFFKGIGVGYDRMLDDQMTWAKSGEAIFNSFAANSKSTLSNVLFDGIKGDLASFSDYWQSFFDSLLKTFTDTIAQMAVQQASSAVVSGLSSIGGAAGSAAINWLSDTNAGGAALDWAGGNWDWLGKLHAGAYYVGDKSGDEYFAKLQAGEMVIPRDAADRIRSTPEWLATLYGNISAEVGKADFQRNEQGQIVSYDPYTVVKNALDNLLSHTRNITKEQVALQIANSGFAYTGYNAETGTKNLLVGTGKEGRDYARGANLLTIDALSKESAGASTISIPAEINRQIMAMLSGSSGGGTIPTDFSGTTSVSPAILNNFMGSLQSIAKTEAMKAALSYGAGATTAQVINTASRASITGLIGAGFGAVIDALMNEAGYQTGSDYSRYGESILGVGGGIIGGPVGAIIGSAIGKTLGTLAWSADKSYGFSQSGRFAGGWERGMAADAASGGYATSNAGVFGEGGTGYFALGGLSRGPESGYSARLHGTEMIVSQKRDVPVKLAGGGSPSIGVIKIYLDGQEIKGRVKIIADGVVVERNRRNVNDTTRVYQ